MSLSVIEISDNNLRVGHEGQCVVAQPGYAFLSKDEVYWGEQAKTMARLHPMHTYNQYWHQLSLDPLRTPTKHHKHYADLAYLQIESLYHISQQQGEVIFATPANFTKSQLSLLLGIAQQCSFDVAGIVDSAVAAIAPLGLDGSVLYVDIQLHQTVISVIALTETAQRTKTEIIHDVGILAIQNQWAQYVTDTFIAQSRFDPLHDASSEQALYNQLPAWVNRSEEEAEFFAEVEGKQAKLNSNALHKKAEHLFERLQQVISTLLPSGGPIYLSSSAAQLAGLHEFLNANILPENQILRACDDMQGHIKSSGEGIAFVTSLPIIQNKNAAPKTNSSANTGIEASDSNADFATHLLDHNFGAIPVTGTMTIGVDGTDLQIGNALAPQCAIKIDKGQMIFTPANGQANKINGETVSQPQTLRPGDILQFGSCEKLLRAIQVYTP